MPSLELDVDRPIGPQPPLAIKDAVTVIAAIEARPKFTEMTDEILVASCLKKQTLHMM